MATHALRLGILACLAAVTTSCTVFSQSRRSDEDPLIIENRGEEVFSRYGITPAERVPDYRVRSETFVVHDVWDPRLIAERVTCGTDDAGDPIVLRYRAEMTIILRVSRSSQAATRVSIGSNGRTLPHDEAVETTPCRLTQPFVAELLSAVTGEPQLVRPPGTRLPGTPDWSGPGVDGP